MGICNEEEEGEWMRDKEQNEERPDTRLYVYMKAFMPTDGKTVSG